MLGPRMLIKQERRIQESKTRLIGKKVTVLGDYRLERGGRTGAESRSITPKNCRSTRYLDRGTGVGALGLAIMNDEKKQ